MMALFCTSGQYSQYWPNQIKGMMSSLWNIVFSVCFKYSACIMYYVVQCMYHVLSIKFGVKLMVAPCQKLEESLHWAEVWDLEDRGPSPELACLVVDGPSPELVCLVVDGPSPELVCLVVDQCEMYALMDGSVIVMKVLCTEPNNATNTAMQRMSYKYKWLPCQTIVRRWRM